ncbi:MAG: hypothetical protein WEB06_16395 [Actinomycetota bacterium]
MIRLLIVLSLLAAGCRQEGPRADEAPETDGTFTAAGAGCLTLASGGSGKPEGRYQPVTVDGFMFVKDLSSGHTVPVMRGDGAGSMSADGRYAAFEIDGMTVYVRDTKTGKEIPVSVLPSGGYASRDVRVVTPSRHFASISADGGFVVFSHGDPRLAPGDSNGKIDIFVRDLVAKTTERVSVSSSGAEADGDSWSGVAAISRDGRHVVFVSSATNLVKEDRNGMSDVFVRDRLLGKTVRVSVASSGEEGDRSGGSVDAAIARDGRFVVFSSGAGNLVPDDKNEFGDVFVHDLVGGGTIRASRDAMDRELPRGAGLRGVLPISADGSCVAFAAEPDPTAGGGRLFLRDLGTGTTRSVPSESDQWPKGFRVHRAEAGSLFPDGGTVLLDQDLLDHGQVSALDLLSGTVVPIHPAARRLWAVSPECSPPRDALLLDPTQHWRICYPSTWWVEQYPDAPQDARWSLESTFDEKAKDRIELVMGVAHEETERSFEGDSACVKGEYITQIIDCGVVEIAGHPWGFQYGIDFNGSHSVWYYTTFGKSRFMGHGVTGAEGDLDARVKMIRSILETSRLS